MAKTSAQMLAALRALLAEEKALPQKPASMGEVLDSQKWSTTDPEQRAAAQAVLSDYLAENGRAGGLPSAKRNDNRYVGGVRVDPQNTGYREAIDQNYSGRMAKARDAIVKQNSRIGAESYDPMQIEPSSKVTVRGRMTSANREMIQGLNNRAERNYWRAVEDPDVLSMSQGNPATLMQKSQPEEKSGLREKILSLARKGDEYIPNGRNPEIIDKLADNPLAASIGLETNAQKDARAARGVGPLEDAADTLTDPKSLALMAILRKVH